MLFSNARQSNTAVETPPAKTYCTVTARQKESLEEWLIVRKRKAWRNGLLSGNFSTYKDLKKTLRAAIRQHRMNLKNRLVHSANHKLFLDYFNHNLGKSRRGSKIRVNESPLSGKDAVCIFNHEFASNFSPKSDVLPTIVDNGMPCASVLFLFNCTEHFIITAPKSYSSSSSSPDNISYRTLQRVARFIIYPLKVFCQHSFNDGIFPARWKQTTVIPLYKGHGNCAPVEFYRPISLCACLGKIVEKDICAQLTSFLIVS